MISSRPLVHVLPIAIGCGLPLLLLVAFVTAERLSMATVPAPVVQDVPATELGIGELEMGREFGRPTIVPERGPVATALLYGLVLLCPAKFLLLWMLQRRESRAARTAAGRPASGGA